jgi:deazaflavin-dependent oxidoreductase (nitroreductase family)
MSAFRTLLDRLAATRPGTWIGLHAASRIDPWLLRRTRGRLSTVAGRRVLILEHEGARTGRHRETPLIFATDGVATVLVASNGGQARHPAWYHNLRANPECRILVRGRSLRCHARVACGGERERLWRLAVEVFGGYETYRRRADSRVIPVVLLEPAD